MGKVSVIIFQMCPVCHLQIKAYYIADDIYEINLPKTLENLPQLGDIEDSENTWLHYYSQW